MSQVYLSQYSRRAAVADSTTSASYAATASYVNPIRLDPIQDPNPTGLLYPASTYLYQSASNTPLGYDMYIRQDGNVVKWKWVEGMLNSGLLYGGVLSYSASSLLITSGAGLIMHYSASTGSEAGPIANYVTWDHITQSVENIATFQNTFVYIDISGSASQQNVFFTPEQYHDVIPIGRISHYDNVVTNGSNMNVQTVYDIDGQQNIFVRAFGPLKLTGIATSGQVSTLRLNIGSGTAFNLGGYYPYDPEKPSTYNMETYNTASIIRIYRDGTGDYVFDNNGGSYFTTINPGDYDDGTGTLASVGNNEYTIQRVMVNPITGRAHVYYGQNVYANYDDAVGAIFSDEFIESDATAFAYPFSAYLVVKGNTTDLPNVENKIVQAGLFRNVGGGGGAGGGGIPGGQDTQIQFNNDGVFDGDPDFTYNYLNSIVTLIGTMIVTGSIAVSGAISTSLAPNTVGFYGTASWAQSASQALTSSIAFSASYASASSFAISASFAETSSISTSASYASSSPNFANANLVFTDNRRHDTDRYSFFLYSDLVGGNETDPFDGFGVSGSFYYFDNDSNSLGTAAGSTNTYTYIEIISESIDLSFNADPASPSAYSFTNQHAYFSSSLTVTNSVYFPNLTSASRPNVVMIDTASGQLYYLNSSSLGTGTPISLDIQDDGTLVLSNPTILNFTGSGVSASADGTTVDIYIPGGGTFSVTGLDGEVVFFSGSNAISGSPNFIFDYTASIPTFNVSGAISSSFGVDTVGFFGTASWAISASQALTSSIAFSASYASSSTSASYAGTASVILNPYPINITGSTLYSVDPPAFVGGVPASASNSIFFGLDAGQSAGQFGGAANNVVGIGVGAGQLAGYGNINYSSFIGNATGYASFYASQSNFIGYQAGLNSQNAHNSNFIGYNAGLEQAYSNNNGGAYSNYIGYQAGVGYLDFNLFENVGPGYNNTIIGTSISLPNGTSNYVNLGGAFFISGTYFNNSPHPIASNYSSNILTESINTAKVGINLWNPSYNFHVSGTVGFPNLTNSNTATKVVLVDNNGQLFTTASNAIGGGGSETSTLPALPTSSIQFNNSGAFGGYNTFTFLSASSEVYLTGSILVLGTSSINGIALIGTSSAQALYTTAKITTIAGLNTIYSLQTSSYDGAFFDYTLISASNARAGQIMSIWSGSEIRYTETTTTDIGSTSEFIFSVALTAGSALLQVTGSAGAIIKTIIKSI